jgi:glycosyltransferase involved in cell wall biosynthesis
MAQSHEIVPPEPPARKLRIGLVSPVWFAVPPLRYGGTEAVVALLADGLAAAGHDVTLFASGDSRTRARLVSVYATAPSERIGQALPELRHALACFERAGEFDVICDHSGPPAAAIGSLLGTPALHTVHGPLDGEAGAAYEQIVRLGGRLALVSVSYAQRRARPRLPWVANCPNAVDPAAFPLRPRRGGDYLLFLGRMCADKGAHRAIDVAREAGMPLLVAAKCREPEERAYFREQVEPRLGRGVEYVGEVGHVEKVRLLHGARATLVPIDWEEPFGLVIVESMATGTPVVATRRGSVPELLDDGRTGVVVDDHREMAAALGRADALDPLELRREVERRFCPERLVRSYLDAIAAQLARRAGGAPPGSVDVRSDSPVAA